MGSITKRKTKSGQVKYLATVRISRQGSPAFSQSRTFSKEILAKEWIKKLESQIQLDPRILHAKKPTGETLGDYISKYVDEVKGQFNDKYTTNMLRIASYDIARQAVANLTRQDFADFALARRRGDVLNMIEGVAPATVLHDLTNISAVLTHAVMVWNEPIAHVQMELKQAIYGLKKSRIVTKAPERERLPSTHELQLLTNFFYQDWRRGRQTIPMHLVMWLAIYTGRRQGELTQMRLSDFDRPNSQWLIRDVKNPDGSRGNHKYAHLEPNALSIINMILDDKVRNRMLVLGYDEGLLLPINAQTVSAYWARACKVLQIDDLKFHDLRHEAATRYAEDGYTVPQLQTITLHSSWKSLQRYVNLKKRAERLEWYDALDFAQAQYDEHQPTISPSPVRHVNENDIRQAVEGLSRLADDGAVSTPYGFVFVQIRRFMAEFRPSKTVLDEFRRRLGVQNIYAWDRARQRFAIDYTHNAWLAWFESHGVVDWDSLPADATHFDVSRVAVLKSHKHQIWRWQSELAEWVDITAYYELGKDVVAKHG